MINIPEKEDIALRIKCFELAKELDDDQDVSRILIISREIYRFILKENDAEIDAVIADFDKRKKRFNRFLSQS